MNVSTVHGTTRLQPGRNGTLLSNLSYLKSRRTLECSWKRLTQEEERQGHGGGWWGFAREHWGASGALSMLPSLMKLCFLCCLRQEGKGTLSGMFLDVLCADCFFTELRQTAVTCRGSAPLALTLWAHTSSQSYPRLAGEHCELMQKEAGSSVRRWARAGIGKSQKRKRDHQLVIFVVIMGWGHVAQPVSSGQWGACGVFSLHTTLCRCWELSSGRQTFRPTAFICWAISPALCSTEPVVPQ